MQSIATAQNSRLAPAKVNAVLVRGLNDDEVEAFASFARETGVIMRFIEFMPLDADRHWTRDVVVPAAEVHQRSEEHTSELQSQSNLVCRLLLEKQHSNRT